MELDMKELNAFATKWLEKFNDPDIDYIELVDYYFATGCKSLGFEMDSGNGFETVYGKAAYDWNELRRVIGDVKDIPLLGSAIYSRWRYFNHWAYDAKDILETENRGWFKEALSRLLILSEKALRCFEGVPEKMSIVSNSFGFGITPGPEEEVVQHLSIDDSGQVAFSVYAYEDYSEERPPLRNNSFTIEESISIEILNKVALYFKEEYYEEFAYDIGMWFLGLTNTEGRTYKYQGSLCTSFEIEGIDLSELIRERLGLLDLYVFDGNDKPEEM